MTATPNSPPPTMLLKAKLDRPYVCFLCKRRLPRSLKPIHVLRFEDKGFYIGLCIGCPKDDEEALRITQQDIDNRPKNVLYNTF
jgi:hypothetical protein